MMTATQQALRALLASLLLGGLCCAGAAMTGMQAPAPRLNLVFLFLLCAGALLALLVRRVRSEDRIADLEASLCREQSARSQSDQALAEADLLLARLAARASGDYAGDPASQLVLIQAELNQIQQRCGADPALSSRIELLRARLERLGGCLRNDSRAAEPG